MHPMLNVAVKAARAAGRVITRASVDIDTVRVASKQRNDFVTEVDRAAEDAIISTLRQAYPTHAFYGEETGLSGNHPGRDAAADPSLPRRMADIWKDVLACEHVWIIDPLDGTTNFIHGLPQYAVSIALMQRGALSQAVVYDPAKDELFTASKGRGAYFNDRRIRVSSRARLDGALIGTGFPFRKNDDIDRYLDLFKRVAMRAAGLRRPGAAALDLAYVACGRYDGFFEMGLMPWDVAAGSLLVTEAGGLIGNLAGDAEHLANEEVLAGNPKVFSQLVALFGTSQS